MKLFGDPRAMKYPEVKPLNRRLAKGLARVVGKPGSLRFRLARDIAGVMVIQALSMGLTFAVSVVLARLLGVREFGLYSLAMSVLGLLVVPATLGFPQLLVRGIAVYRVKSEWGLIRGLLRFAQRTSMLASLGIALLGSLVLWVLADRLPVEAVGVLALAFVALPFWALLELQGASLRGFDQILAGQWASAVMRPLCFLLMVGALWFFPGRIANAPLVLGLHILAAGVALALAFYLLRSQLHCSIPSNAVNQNIPVWVRSSLSLTILGLLNLIPQHAGILMLGWMRSVEEVGLYKVAYQTASLIPFGLLAVSIVIAPTLAQLYAVKDKAKLLKTIINASGIATVFALPLAVLCTGGGEQFLRRVFGEAFTEGAISLTILALGQFFNVLTGPCELVLLMSGNEKQAILANGLGSGIIVLLNALLIPFSGIKGAASAATITLVLIKSLRIYFVFKSLREDLYEQSC